MKTAKDVQGEVYSLISGSTLASFVSGGVYRNGYRPRGSRKEDIVVTFVSSMVSSTRVLEGVVNINVFVPDIDPYDNGVWVEDGARTAELERALDDFVSGIDPTQTEYLFRLREAVFTLADPESRQHFVTARIGFRHI